MSKWTKITKVKVTPPVPSPDRHGMALVAVVKDEGDYLGEWIAFHQEVGVRKFILYDNGSTDDGYDVARKLLSDDALAWIPWRGNYWDGRYGLNINVQSLAHAHAVNNFGHDLRWMAFVDPDEFILPVDGNNIVEILNSRLSTEVNISLPWHQFGPNGHVEKPEGLSIESYTERYAGKIFPGARFPFKCIVDPCEVTIARTHNFETRRDGVVTANDAGQRVPYRKRSDDSFYSAKRLKLHHYYSRSHAEMKAKVERGRVSSEKSGFDPNRGKAQIEMIANSPMQDTDALRFVEPVRARLGAVGLV